MSTVSYDVEGQVAIITLNRPEKLNAWTYQMGAELSRAVAEANDNEDINAIVVTGAGRGFCAGADIGDVLRLRQTVRTSAATTNPGTGWGKCGGRSPWWRPSTALPLASASRRCCPWTT